MRAQAYELFNNKIFNIKFIKNKKFYYVLSNVLSTNLEKNIFIWKIYICHDYDWSIDIYVSIYIMYMHR